MRVWHEGRLLKGRVAVSAFDRGLTLGDGVFETIAVTNGTPLWRSEHVERMGAAARELGIPFPADKVDDCMNALIHRAGGHSVLRLTLTRGDVARGLGSAGKTPALIGTLKGFDSGLRFQPASLVTSTVRRNLHSPSSRLKTLSYIDNILAAREAEAAKADDALMLNSEDRIACTTVGNVFLVVDGVLVTPPLDEAILPGIMRAAVIAAAKHLNIPVQDMKLNPPDAVGADAMFTTNSLRFIRPVTSLDGKRMRTTSKTIKALMQSLLNSEQKQCSLK